MDGETSFAGAKVALFLGGALLVIRRDRDKDIPWPGFLDLPGGGREGGESPQDCALRETREETGLRLDRADLVWSDSHERPHGTVWVFAARLPAERARDVIFGGEGTGWSTMPPEDYLTHPEAIPHFRDWVRDFLHARAGG